MLPPENRSSKISSKDAAGRIITVASRLLFSYGYNALTMDALAHELGVSKKTIYRCFESKDAIVHAIINDYVKHTRGNIDAIINAKDSDFTQKLNAVIQFIIPRISEINPVLLRELQRYAPDIHRYLDDMRKKNIPEIWSRLLRIGIEQKMIRPEIDPDFTAQFILQAMRGMIEPETLAKTKLSIHETIHKAFVLLLNGILIHPRPSIANKTI